MSFDSLPTELLIVIFNFLEFKDLSRLRGTCRRFRDVIDARDNVLIRGTPLVSNQKSDEFLERCYSKINTKLEKLRLENNWTNGFYEEKSIFHTTETYAPWLQLNKDTLWFSRGTKIRAHHRNKDTIITDKPDCEFALRHHSLSSETSITKFTVQGSILVAGLEGDGGVYIQNITNEHDRLVHKVEHDYTCDVDVTSDGLMVASGMIDGRVHIFALRQDPLELTPIHIQELEVAPLCVKFSKDAPLFACGASRFKNRKCIWVFDTERYTEILSLRLDFDYGATTDIIWDGPHVLWSCGFEGCVRKWDLRSGTCVQKIEDVSNAISHCMAYDYCNTVMVGARYDTRISLSDVRANRRIQSYFMRISEGATLKSPIYSMSFDSQYLFAALDQSLTILDFSTYIQS